MKAYQGKEAYLNPIEKGPYGGKLVLLRIRVREPRRSIPFRIYEEDEHSEMTIRDYKSQLNVHLHRNDPHSRLCSSSGRGKKCQLGKDSDGFDDYDGDRNGDSHNGIHGNLSVEGELDNNYESSI